MSRTLPEVKVICLSPELPRRDAWATCSPAAQGVEINFAQVLMQAIRHLFSRRKSNGETKHYPPLVQDGTLIEENIEIMKAAIQTIMYGQELAKT